MKQGKNLTKNIKLMLSRSASKLKFEIFYTILQVHSVLLSPAMNLRMLKTG